MCVYRLSGWSGDVPPGCDDVCTDCIKHWGWQDNAMPGHRSSYVAIAVNRLRVQLRSSGTIKIVAMAQA